ncbi:sigma-70 family RNA polymerase sigma factor [Rhizobium halophilum]|uniref:sigma-70 family RNA polymerase sigma factor n=1 Tax=Rhizobium halophilum TaxID=2846852 RepID=UPI001EFCDF3E|nr:sigma-70 family RNA polymerase sigma factor [Rhizobium halophilum]MCF6370911.1 sigma-70 family RNA polymerase sigma factor [Rhizobium halophilum]
MTEGRGSERTATEMVELLPGLRSFARRFDPNPYNIEDLVQETLAKALANRDKFREGTNLKSWLFTIMRNTFCTKYGVAKREPLGSDDCVAAQPSISAPQEWSLRAKEVARQIERLPLHYRSAVQLILIEEISYEAAADRAGCPVGTIKSRVNRARTMLETRLGEAG